MRTAVAIDAGGTSTRAVVVDESATCRGMGRAGAGNASSSGVEHAVANFSAATSAALSDAAVRGADTAPELVVLTAAGMHASTVEPAAEAFAALGIDRLETAGDVESAYFSGTAAPNGFAVIVGTGAICAELRDGQLVSVRDGIGYLLGDEGSGFWIGQAVARAVAAALDGRGPETGLTPLVLDGIPPSADARWPRDPQLAALVAQTYRGRAVELAAYARHALALPDDPVAARIVAEAADRILRLVASTVGDAPGPVVLAGGLLFEGSPLAQPLRDRWPGRCLRAEDGLAGAALLALRHMGVRADGASLERIQQSLATLRQVA